MNATQNPDPALSRCMPSNTLSPLSKSWFSNPWNEARRLDRAILLATEAHRRSSNSHLSPQLPSLPFCEISPGSKIVFGFLFACFWSWRRKFWSPCGSLETPLPVSLLWLAFSMHRCYMVIVSLFCHKKNKFSILFPRCDASCKDRSPMSTYGPM